MGKKYRTQASASNIPYLVFGLVLVLIGVISYLEFVHDPDGVAPAQQVNTHESLRKMELRLRDMESQSQLAEEQKSKLTETVSTLQSELSKRSTDITSVVGRMDKLHDLAQSHAKDSEEFKSRFEDFDSVKSKMDTTLELVNKHDQLIHTVGSADDQSPTLRHIQDKISDHDKQLMDHNDKINSVQEVAKVLRQAKADITVIKPDSSMEEVATAAAQEDDEESSSALVTSKPSDHGQHDLNIPGGQFPPDIDFDPADEEFFIDGEDCPVQLNLKDELDGARGSLLYFLHIPKTGGMTFWSMLLSSVPKQFKRAPMRFDSNFARNSRAVNLQRSAQKFKNGMKAFSYVVGHSDITVEDAVAPRQVITATMVREPVHRMISWYFFVMNIFNRTVKMQSRTQFESQQSARNRNKTPTKQLSEEELSLMSPEKRKFAVMMASEKKRFNGTQMYGVTAGFKAFMNYREFVEHCIKFKLDNYQTRAYAGLLGESFVDELHPDRREWDDGRMLRAAKLKLMSLPFVGLTERYADSMELLSWTFQGSTVPQEIRSRNVTPKYKYPSTEMLNWISEVERLDRKLYKFATRLFDHRLALMRKCAGGQVGHFTNHISKSNLRSTTSRRPGRPSTTAKDAVDAKKP
eukprot:TRINITY_DN11080_c0_g1_i1.p1 TRINITY_DN11080_c0_g1~~TRINITY_DN11080_c0_g1_i1.p1  ORF type:complete len:634 (-),score=143.07 TRINITY_DN11080_c0_g1_i1:64-1965(-)